MELIVQNATQAQTSQKVTLTQHYLLSSKNATQVQLAVALTILTLRENGSRNFNGTTDRIDFPNISTYTGGAFTLSLWLNLHRVQGKYQILFAINNTGNTQGSIYLSNPGDYKNGCITIVIKGATSSWRTSLNYTALFGQWTNLIATWDGVSVTSISSHAKLYKNGIEVSYDNSSNGTDPQMTVGGTVSLGGYSFNDTYNMDGQIGEVAFWNRVLTAGERATVSSIRNESLKSAINVPSGLLFLVHPDEPKDIITGASGTLDGTTLAYGPDLEYYTLTVNNSVQAQTSEKVTLTAPYLLVVGNSTQAQTSENVTLTYRGIIISIDNETGDTSQYTSTSGSVSVTSNARLAATNYGLELFISEGRNGYATKSIENKDETGVISVRFYFDPNDLYPTGDDIYINLLSIKSWGNSPLADVAWYKDISLEYPGTIRATITRDEPNPPNISTSDYPFENKPHWIEIILQRASGSEISDGAFYLAIDGKEKEILSNIYNYFSFLDFKNLWVGDSNPGSGYIGTIYIDEVVASNTFEYLGSSDGLIVDDSTHLHASEDTVLTYSYSDVFISNAAVSYEYQDTPQSFLSSVAINYEYQDIPQSFISSAAIIYEYNYNIILQEVNNAVQAQTSENINLPQVYSLSINSAVQAHTAENIVLPLAYSLLVDNTIQLQTSTKIERVGRYTLLGLDYSYRGSPWVKIASRSDINLDTLDYSYKGEPFWGYDGPEVTDSAAQSQTSDNITLTYHEPSNSITIQNSEQIQSSDNVSLTQNYSLSVNNATQIQTADNVTLTAHEPSGLLIVQNATQAQTSENVTLTQNYSLTVQDSTQTQKLNYYTFVDGFGGDVNTACDTLLSKNAPEYNYGIFGHNTINGDGTSFELHPILLFTLTSLVGKTISSATFTIYTGGGGDTDDYYVHRILPANAGWIEGTKYESTAGSGEPCWEAKEADGAGGVTTAWAGSEGCSTSGTDYSSTVMGTINYDSTDPNGTEYNIGLDLTEFSLMISNNAGLILRGGTPWTQARLWAAEASTESYRPKLVVYYTIPLTLESHYVLSVNNATQTQTSGNITLYASQGVIVDINHEVGDTSEYTTTSGKVSVTKAAALAGTGNGLNVLIDDTTADYGRKNLTTNTSGKIRVRHYVDPNSFTMSVADAFYCFEAYNTSNNVVLFIKLRVSGGSYQAGAVAVNDVPTQVNTSWYSFGGTNDGPHYIEALLTRSTNADSNNGVLTLWLDGAQKETITNLDNYARFNNLSYVWLGAIGMAATTTGTIFLDELVVNDTGEEIGPNVYTPINNAAQAQTSDNISLIQHYILSVNNATQAQTSDNISLIQHSSLIINNTTQNQITNNLIVIPYYGIIVDINHETNDLSQYDETYGDISVTSDAGLAKTNYGISLPYYPISYGKKEFNRSVTKKLSIRFYMNISFDSYENTLPQDMPILGIEGGGLNPGGVSFLLNVPLSGSVAEYNGYVYVNSDFGPNYTSSYSITKNEEHCIEIRYIAETGYLTFDGSVELLIDGISKEVLSNIGGNYNKYTFDNLNFGCMLGDGTNNPTGFLYLDELIINDTGEYIGQIFYGKDVVQLQTSDNINLSQNYTLSVNNVVQTQQTSSLNLIQSRTLNVLNATQAQTADNISLTQHYILSINNTTQLQISNNINLIQNYRINVNNSIQAQRASKATILNIRENGARIFNGTTDRVDFDNIFNPAGSPLTISAWVNVKDYHTNQYIINLGRADNNAGVMISLNTAACLQLYRYGSTYLSRWSTVNYFSNKTNEWHNIIATHDGTFNDLTTIHIYDNGVEISYVSGTNGSGEAPITGLWSLGGRAADDLRNFDGEIGEVAVWNRVLSAGEIAQVSSLTSLSSATNILSGLVFVVHPDEPKDLITSASGTLDGTTLTYGPDLDFPDYSLTVQNSTQTQVSDNISLTQHHILIVNNTTQLQKFEYYLAKIGSFNVDTTKTPGQTQTISGVGFQPKLVLFWWSGGHSTGEELAGGDYTIGFGATNGTSECVSLVWSQDNLTTSNTNSYGANDRCIKVYSAGEQDGDFYSPSFNADGFVLTVAEQFTNDYRISYLALGGDDLTNTFIGSGTTHTVIENKSYTGIGFKPDAILFLFAVGANMSLGMATGSNNQGVAVAIPYDNASTTVTRGYGYNGEVISGALSRDAFVSIDDDGFTLNHLETTTERPFYYICLKGGQYLVGDLTTRTDSNDISETIGFKPVALLFASANRALSTQDVRTAHARMSIGAATSSSNRACAAISDEDNLGDTETAFANYDSAVYAHVKDDAIEALMDIKSINDDGFTAVMDDVETNASWVTYLSIGGEKNISLTQNYILTVNNSSQLHTSGNISLTQHYLLLINNSIQVQTSENVNLIQHYSLLVNGTTQVQTSENVNLIQHYSLTVNSTTQSQTSENVNLTQHYSLSINNTTHQQTSDSVNLTQHYLLSVNNAVQVQETSLLNLMQSGTVYASDATQVQISENVNLTQHHILFINSATQSHISNNVVLTYHEVSVELIVQNAVQTHISCRTDLDDYIYSKQYFGIYGFPVSYFPNGDGNLNLSYYPGGVSLVVQNATQAQTSESVNLTQNYLLYVNNTTHIQTSENVNLVQHHSLLVNNATQTQTSDNVNLTQHYSLSVNNATQAQISGSVSLTQHYSLSVNNATQAQTSDNVNLTQHYSLAVNNATHTQSSENVNLIQHYSLAVNNAVQLQTSENVDLTQHYNITVNNSTHLQTSDNVNLTQHQILQVSDSIQIQTSDNINLTQHHILVVQNSTQIQTTSNIFLNGYIPTYLLWIIGWYDGALYLENGDYLFFEDGTPIILENLTGATIHYQTSDNVILSAHYFITVNNATQTQTAENISLTQNYLLAINSSTHQHTAQNVNLTQHYLLSINNATQVHTSENIVLIQNYSLFVNNASHIHTSEQVVLTQNYSLFVNSATQLQTSENVALTQHHSLGIHNSTHVQTTTNIYLTQHHILSVNNSTHVQTANKITLIYQGYYNVVVNDSIHLQTSEKVNLTQHYSLFVNNSTHIQTSEKVNLIQHHILNINNAVQAQTSENVTLIQHYVLVINNSIHSHTSENVSLVQHYLLSTNNAVQIQTSENVNLTQHYVLSTNNAVHFHTAENVVLVQHYLLTVNNATHIQTSGNVNLTQHHVLTINNATHLQTSKKVDLAQHFAGAIFVNNAVHLQISENVNLTQHYVLFVNNAVQIQTSEKVSLSQKYTLTVNNPYHLQTSEKVSLTQNYRLAIDSSYHSQTSEKVNLTQHHLLSVNNSVHTHTSEKVILVHHGYWLLSVQNSTHLHTTSTIALSQLYTLIVSNTIHAHTAQNVELLAVYGVGVHNSTHPQTSENVNLTQHHILGISNAVQQHTTSTIYLIAHYTIPSVDNSTHLQTSEQVTINQIYRVSVNDSTHLQTSESVILSAFYGLRVDNASHIHTSSTIIFTRYPLLIQDAIQVQTAQRISVYIHVETPVSRIFFILPEDRYYEIEKENRALFIEIEDRFYTIIYERRFYIIKEKYGDNSEGEGRVLDIDR